MKINIIVAADRNGLIGNGNKLPWKLPADLAHFKNTTMGYPIIMGRKTHESIGRVLPGRENIVLTRDRNYKAEGCTIYHSFEEIERRDGKAFVIGGAEIIEYFLPIAEKLYYTYIDEAFEGDIYLPEINFMNWSLTYTFRGYKDDKNLYDYTFFIYERKKE